MIKVAMVGLGGMGGAHFRLYKDIEDVEVIAVCEIREDMAKDFDSQWQEAALLHMPP